METAPHDAKSWQGNTMTGTPKQYRRTDSLKPLTGLLLAAMLVLAACDTPPQLHYPEISFADRPPLRIAAASLEIVDAYSPPLAPPHVEHLAPAVPSIVFRRWAERRLIPAGGGAHLRVTIEDARIVETPLPVNETLMDNLTVEQAARLDGYGAVSVALIGTAGDELARVRGEAMRSRSIPEDATINERRELMYQITESLARALDGVLEEHILRHFADWLRQGSGEVRS